MLNITRSIKLPLIVAFFGALIVSGCGDSALSQSGDPYTISGTLANTEGKLYLTEVVDGEISPVDSVDLTDGNFSFSGKIDQPEMKYLFLEGARAPIEVFASAGDIAVDGDFADPNSATVTGSATHDVYKSFNNELLGFDSQMEALYPIFQQASAAGDTATVNMVSKQAEELEAQRVGFIENYINNNLGSQVAAFAAVRYFMRSADDEKLKAVYESMKSAQPSSTYVAKVGDYVAKMESLKVGAVAPDFTLSDQQGKEVSLSDFRGKYVLIDFWASWCGPCRRENPNVVAMYNQYKDMDFEILGVSLDDKKDAWLQAIAADQLTWAHVSDLKGWGSEAAGLYEVRAIPATVLLDKKGTIIARDLRGEQLEEKLSEILL